MSPAARLSPLARLFVVAVVAVVILAGAIPLAIYLLVRVNYLAEVNKMNGEYVVECTTPGPEPPPVTGHRCFDDAQRRTAEAIAQIVDANGNGRPDLGELADALGLALAPPTTVQP